MSVRLSETIVPFAPAGRSPVPNGDDPLDSAGHSILGLLQRAAGMAEENSQHALGIAHKLSLQLRAAEDRIKDLEADVQHYRDRADRAEKWLHHISAEIEQQFFKPDGARAAPAPTSWTPGLRTEELGRRAGALSRAEIADLQRVANKPVGSAQGHRWLSHRAIEMTVGDGSDQQGQQSGQHEPAKKHRPVPGIEAQEPAIGGQSQGREARHYGNLFIAVCSFLIRH